MAISSVRREAMPRDIAVSVLVTTLNEERNLPRCLAALERFAEIIVIDSGSADATQQIARSLGASVVTFIWNGRYPKKRQWCLDHLDLEHERVFFVDADEEVTPELCDEIAALDWAAAGYFVKGMYVIDGKALRFGLKNSKLCLFDRRKIEFPVVDDLDIPGMGEIEGHYQPVLKESVFKEKIGTLANPLFHYALEDRERWQSRHDGYKQWQKGIKMRCAAPKDPKFLRACLKNVFHTMPGRSLAAFAHSYFVLGGFMDGAAGFALARSRYLYYTK